MSWIFLWGRCRLCSAPISVLYPFIELVTALCLSTLFVTVPPHYFPAYFIFFSALIISIRTDLETMLISRFVTLFLLPTGIIFSAMGLLPITYQASVAGSFFGYFLLWGVARLFFLLTKKEGLGLGDAELLAFIGSYTGIVGCWLSLLIGSIAGSIAGIIHLWLTNSNKIPFGPFLALGSISYVLLKPLLLRLFLGPW